jgi:hypothetical protein
LPDVTFQVGDRTFVTPLNRTITEDTLQRMLAQHFNIERPATLSCGGRELAANTNAILDFIHDHEHRKAISVLKRPSSIIFDIVGGSSFDLLSFVFVFVVNHYFV